MMYEYMNYNINDRWINTRYRRNKKKHITPALETKENKGIVRNNHEESNEYIKLDSNKILHYTSIDQLRHAKKVARKKEMFKALKNR